MRDSWFESRRSSSFFSSSRCGKAYIQEHSLISFIQIPNLSNSTKRRKEFAKEYCSKIEKD